MKKVALVFVLAVFVPSLVLAWLAVRSLRDEQFILERQQTLLCQSIADTLAKQAADLVAEHQREFGKQVESLLAMEPVAQLTPKFDDRIRDIWPAAEVGFVVAIDRSAVMCPPLLGRPEARRFRMENDSFLCNAETAEVYWDNQKVLVQNSLIPKGKVPQYQQQVAAPPEVQSFNQNPDQPQQQLDSSAFNSRQQQRAINPQRNYGNQGGQAQIPEQNVDQNFSKLVTSEIGFRDLVGDATEGTVARFLQDKLNVMVWYRPPQEPQTVFGVKLRLASLKDSLRQVVKNFPGAYQPLGSELSNEICVALLDDGFTRERGSGNIIPVALSHPSFTTNWKRPLVASEIGETLPHWEMAVYLLDPAKLTHAAERLRWTFGLLIALLIFAIGVGGWLLFNDLRRELALARQKTDFVSNVSHELKTPLTSIRMFAELLAERRVTDPAKQQSYLNIITSEAARLTRLINNVLDFSRMERGEKKYNFEKCDLVDLTREAAENFRPHLETSGFQFKTTLPADSLPVNGDRDALAQIIVNLLSNAEKYSNGVKEVELTIQRRNDPVPHTELQVLDRGFGVPKGCEEKIFEQFFRAHDSLSSGIQGSGLGLTLARKIARAHGGDITYTPREGGGSCFTLRLPLNGPVDNRA